MGLIAGLMPAALWVAFWMAMIGCSHEHPEDRPALEPIERTVHDDGSYSTYDGCNTCDCDSTGMWCDCTLKSCYSEGMMPFSEEVK